MTTDEVEALAKVWHEAMEKGADERGVMMGLPIAGLEVVARAVRAKDAARGGEMTEEELERVANGPTPGPWRVRELPRKYMTSYEILGPGGAHVGYVQPVDEEDDYTPAEANARLAAAAPALLVHSAAQGRTIAARDARIAVLEKGLAQSQSEARAYKRDFDAELDGNRHLREKYGARENETFFQFIDRLFTESRAAESALATLRQVDMDEWAEDVICAAAQWGDFDDLWGGLTQTARDGVQRDIAKRLTKLLDDALSATPSEHPDTATLRAIRERVKDESALVQAHFRGGLLGVVAYLLGDSGPSGGGEVRDCGACGGPLPSHRDAVCETCTPERSAHSVAASMMPTTPQDVAASEPKPTPEEDWRTVENAVASGYSKKSLAWAALSRLKAEPRRAAEEGAREALCSLLERLGSDGAHAWRSGMSEQQMSDALWETVRDSERRAAEAMRERCADLLTTMWRNEKDAEASDALLAIRNAIRTLPL